MSCGCLDKTLMYEVGLVGADNTESHFVKKNTTEVVFLLLVCRCKVLGLFSVQICEFFPLGMN